MKKLFIVLCDILAASAAVAAVAFVAWSLGALFGWAVADTAGFVFTVAFVIIVAATILSYIVWANGGDPNDTKEGDK